MKRINILIKILTILAQTNIIMKDIFVIQYLTPLMIFFLMMMIYKQERDIINFMNQIF